MAAKPKSAKAKAPLASPRQVRSWPRTARRLVLRLAAGVVALYAALILIFTAVNPPTNLYIASESLRLGGVARDWVPMEAIAPAMARSVVAAEDANFCLHWGFDLAAIREAVAEGGGRGASTLSQQVVKNVFLWHGRSWVRKAGEAVLTPAVELVWTKRRLLEVYLNVAEFDEGVFGVEAAAQHHFGVSAIDLTAAQAARLAAVLPDPKGRSAGSPSDFVRSRSRAIRAGAETIAADGRAACFELSP